MIHDEITALIQKELKRQQQQLSLIASENHASAAVRDVQASVLTNKYAEGYPGQRYYAGCLQVDAIENLAIQWAQQLFNVPYANVQPHSGSQANEAVYAALLKPHDCILAMSLKDGGHLTHGAKVSFSGRFYNAVHYGVRPDDGLIDYDQVALLAAQHQPKLIIAGFSAYSRVLDWAKFRAIADQVGAYLLADIAHVAGLIAADVYPSPFPHAHVATSTTHKTLRGPRGGIILAHKDVDDLFKRLNFAVFPFSQGGPMMHTIAAKAIAFQEALQPSFIQYQQQVVANARAMVETFKHAGFHVVSGQTENHQFSIDLSRNTDLTGQQVEQVLEHVGIIVNKNAVPGDQRSPRVTSGIRIGTPAVTTRGMKEDAVCMLADLMVQTIENIEQESVLNQVKKAVLDLAHTYPCID